MTDKKKPTGTGKLIASIALYFVGELLAIILAIFDSTKFTWTMAIAMFVYGVAILGLVCALGGKDIAKPTLKGTKECWKLCWLLLAVAVADNVFDIVVNALQGKFLAVEPGWPVRALMIAVYCLGIGMNEEASYRGIVQNGVLARFGQTKRGMVAAVAVTFVAFGLVHVLGSPLSTPLTATQWVLKFLQTGLISVAFSAVVIQTRTLWPAIIFHATYDFVSFFMETGLSNGNAPQGDYIQTTENAMELLPAIIQFVVIIALSVPVVISAVRIIRDAPVPDRGAFMPSDMDE